MNYETFRNEFAGRLMDLPADQLQHVLSALDTIAAGYDISKVRTDLTVYSDSVPEAVKTFLASKAIQKMSRKTLSQYSVVLTNFFKSVRLSPDQINANTIRLYLYNYQQERNISDSSLDHIRVVLNSFFAWCVQDHLLPENPCAHVGTIKYQEPVREPLSPIQLEIIRRSCRLPRDKFIVDFLYSTACRASEFCSLLKSDVDLSNGTVRIRHGKGNKSRISYLNAEAIVSLHAYLDTRSDDCPYLLVSSHRPAHEITVGALERAIRGIRDRSGLQIPLFPHLFRHTAATSALSRGMAIDQVKQFLGLARMDTTLRYAKTLEADIQASHRKALA